MWLWPRLCGAPSGSEEIMEVESANDGDVVVDISPAKDAVLVTCQRMALTVDNVDGVNWACIASMF